MTCTQNWEVPYPINDDILKHGERASENSVSNTVWESPLLKSLYKINGTFNHKTFNADHLPLTSSKHTRSLATKGEFL